MGKKAYLSLNGSANSQKRNEQTRQSPEEFANRLGLTFQSTCLLTRALTHRSYINEHPNALEDNERLEFLGDAVLSFFVASWLYHHFPEMAEGKLTALRAALVRNEQLADFARDLEIGEAVFMGRGEIEAGGRERTILLGSVFEALIGALYLDGGMEKVQRFLEPLLGSAVQNILIHQRHVDPKSRLQEHTQAKGIGTPHYRTLSSTGPEHQPTYTVEVLVGEEVLGEGSGPSKQAATKSAAEDALQRLGVQIEIG